MAFYVAYSLLNKPHFGLEHLHKIGPQQNIFLTKANGKNPLLKNQIQKFLISHKSQKLLSPLLNPYTLLPKKDAKILSVQNLNLN